MHKGKKPKTITYRGKTLTINQWAAHLGVNAGTIMRRLHRGMPLDRVLSPGRLERSKTYNRAPRSRTTTRRPGVNAKVERDALTNAIHRCHNPRHPCYKNYGQRGIRVHEEWQEDFWAFYDYLGPKPSKELTLERIDNDGNYEPGNVMWADRKQQQNNRRCTAHEYKPERQITYRGETRTLEAWAVSLGMTVKGFQSRLRRGKTGDDLMAPKWSKRG